jgi:hypothetical protein
LLLFSSLSLSLICSPLFSFPFNPSSSFFLSILSLFFFLVFCPLSQFFSLPSYL